MTDNDDLNLDKVRAVIAHAWAGLDPADRADRIAHDIAHNVAGVTMQTGSADDLIEFVRGGRRLALVHRDVLCGDGPLDGAAVFIAELPDTVPDELGGNE